MSFPADRPTLLHDVLLETPWLEIDCQKCGRNGRLRVTRLIDKYGPIAEAWTAVEAASADCPRKGETRMYEICGVICPTLSRYSSCHHVARPTMRSLYRGTKVGNKFPTQESHTAKEKGPKPPLAGP